MWKLKINTIKFCNTIKLLNENYNDTCSMIRCKRTYEKKTTKTHLEYKTDTIIMLYKRNYTSEIILNSSQWTMPKNRSSLVDFKINYFLYQENIQTCSAIIILLLFFFSFNFSQTKHIFGINAAHSWKCVISVSWKITENVNYFELNVFLHFYYMQHSNIQVDKNIRSSL